MLIAIVQSLICSFDEDLAPFDQGGGHESGHRADEYFLDERGLHSLFNSTVDAIRGETRGQKSDWLRPLPEAPLLGLHDPHAEEQIRESVGNYTGG